MKPRTYIWLIFLSVLLGTVPSLLFAQNSSNLSPVLEQVHALSDSAWGLETSDQEAAIRLYKGAVELSQKHGLGVEEGKNLRYIGLVHKNDAQFDSAQIWMERADSVLAFETDTLARAKTMFSLATIHQFKGSSESSASCYMDALRLFQLLEDSLAVAKCSSNLGVLYYELNMFDKAAQFDSVAVSMGRQLNQPSSLASALINLGIASSKLDRTDVSFRSYQEALMIGDSLNDNNVKLYALTNLADYYANRSEYDFAIENARKALRLARKEENSVEESSILHQLGYLYEKVGDSGGLDTMLVALEMNQMLGLRPGRVLLLNHISEAYASRGEHAVALNYARQMQELKDELASEGTLKLVNDLREKYEASEREQEISQLTKEQDLANERHQKDQQRMFLLLSLLVLIVLLGTLVVINYRSKLRSNKIIAEQERALNEKRLAELKNQQMIQSLDDMLKGQQQERERIARDLHDGLGGLLSSVQMRFGSIQDTLKKSEINDTHDEAFDMLSDACVEVRRIAHDMMPGSLEKLGLFPAVKDLLGNIEANSTIEVVADEFGNAIKLESGKATMIYRIIQELVTNAIKYAEPSELVVQFNWHKDHLALVVEDNGKGFDSDTVEMGLGLKSIDARVNYLQAEWEMESQENIGTSARISVPLESIDKTPDSRTV